MQRPHDHVGEEPLALVGDYNVIPEPRDAAHPELWTGDALFLPETRAKFRELLARLRALLRRPKELRAPRIVVGELELDTASQTAKRGARSIPLTTKEYALLEYFARNAGRVVGRSEIAEHVWDETFDPFSNLIEVYVNRLRRKLGDEEGKPLLQTRRGSGYVLCAADSSGRKTSAQTAPGNKKPHV